MITFVSEIMVCLSLVEGNFDKSVHTAACLLGILLHKYYLFSSLKSTHFVLELQMDIYTHPATEVTACQHPKIKLSDCSICFHIEALLLMCM